MTPPVGDACLQAIDVDLVESLYQELAHDLARVRRYQRLLRTSRYDDKRAAANAQAMLTLSESTWQPVEFGRFTSAQFDDLEAELTYMLLRTVQPSRVIEISPHGGWSTSWILNALKDNGHGIVRSFDLIDESIRRVPRDLSDGAHEFVLGDVRDAKYLPDEIEYLFLDSDHTATFAHWIVREVLPRVRSGGVVSVHDVFHPDGPATSGGEGTVILDWLRERGIEWFTLAPSERPEVYERIEQVKLSLNIAYPICESTANSCLFFVMP